MRKNMIATIVTIMLIFVISAFPQSVTFTGDVETDFTHANVITIVDPGTMDVGIPPAFPPGTISGHDMKDMRFLYDPSTDIMYIGINTYGIAGDADGDGDGGNTSSYLVTSGGVDQPDFGGTESFNVIIDMDQDDTFDIIVGVSGSTDITGFTAAEFSGNIYAPAFAFGTALPQHTGTLYANPSSSAPDLEFTITQFSKLPCSSGADTSLAAFAFNSFIGSLEDDGIGEDYLPGAGQSILLELAAIGDTVWADINKNGIQDNGEQGVEGVTVNLYDSGDNLVASTQTDSTGKYSFILLPAGDYYLIFQPSSSYAFTSQDQGSDDEKDSDANTTTGRTATTNLAGQEEDLSWDAGLILLDFGDAPDPTYPTLIANDGARHFLDGITYLGSGVDFELDGQQNSSATGDDTDGNDDEDGVTFVSNISAGEIAVIRVVASVEGRLDAWIDFNADGDWLDAGEQICTTYLLSAGTNTLNVNIPQTAENGTTFSRFRFSANGDLNPTGQALEGEVEDYQITIVAPEYDFGDAPDPNYPTLSASNGAYHFIVNGYFLGASIDNDADGQPDATSLGDDNDGSDDEDGVSFSSPLMQYFENSVDITASAAGYVNAWMDFNRDGDWDDSGEHIIVDEAVTSGSNTVNFQVPLIDATGELRNIGISSRFRFCSQQGLSYDGSAIDGEVEDYQIDVLIPVELSSFQAVATDGAVQIRWTTASETENLGFHIFRSQTQNGDYEKVSLEMIKGAGNTEAQRNYNFVDETAETGKSYYYRLADYSINGGQRMHDPVKVSVDLPSEYKLEQNYPNPFNPQTKIKFLLKEAGKVEITVFNMQGQLIRTLINKNMQAGAHQAVWDGRNNQGVQVPSGAYLYKLRVNGFEQIKKMMFTK